MNSNTTQTMEATSRLVAAIPRWFLVSVLLILLIPLVHHFILHHLKTQMGIEMSAIRVHVLPKISLEVFDFLVRDNRNAETILRAPHASLTVSLWPLLTKQLPILALRAVEPDVVIRRDREGLWHVPLVDDKKMLDDKNPPSDSSHQPWTITDVQLIDGHLLILDEDRLAGGGVTIHNVQAAFQSNQSQTHAEVMLTGKTQDGAELRVTGSLALEKKGSLTTSNTAIVPTQFEGTFHVHHFNLAYWLERTGQSVAVPSMESAWRGNISAGLHLDLLSGTQGFNVRVSDMKTELDWLVIRGHGIIQSAGTDHPAYAVRLSTTPVSSETFFAYVPSSWIPEQVQVSVDEHDLKGTFELVSVALRGQINVLREPEEWQAVVKLVNGRGVWGTERTLIHNLSGTASLEPKRAEVTDLAGEVNGVHVTSSKVTVSDLDLGPTLDAHLLGVGKLEHMLALLQQFNGVSTPALRSITDPTGTLHLAVHITGPIMPKLSLQLIQAEIRGQDLGGRLPKNVSVTQMNGNIVANSSFLWLKQIRGVVEGIHFEAEGAVDVAPVTRVDKLAVKVSSDGAAIQQFLSAHLSVPPDVLIDGPARATLQLSGTTRLAHCSGKIDLTETELILSPVAHKKRGLPGILEFEGSLVDGKRVILDRAVLFLRDSHIDADGAIDLGRTPRFHLQMKAGPVSLRTLADAGVMTPVTDGILEASARVSGEGTDWKLWTPSGWVSMRSGVVTIPVLQEKVSEVSGRLQITARDALLQEVSLKFGDSDVKLTGMVEHWRSHPEATFMVESSELDVARLLPSKISDPVKTNGTLQEWMQSKQATLTFLIKQVRYERLFLRSVSGEIKVDQRKAELNGLRGETPEGRLSGRIAATLGPRQRMDLDAEVLVDGIPAEHLLSGREDETKPLQGNLAVNGAMQATVDADTTIQNTLHTADHGLSIKVTSGRLHQDPVLTKILQILNIPAVLIGQVDLEHDGIPFDSLSARVIARDGVLSSEGIVLDSPIIKVTGAGTADITRNELDLALAVSPLAAYSDLIGKIPLFGPLLGGDRPGLSTALFEAKGPLLDPDVHYLPFESFGKGLTGYPRIAIDVLVNTLTLPQTVLAYSAQ